MPKPVLALVIGCLGAFAQTEGISNAPLGYLVTQSQELRPVYGVAASFTLGDPVAGGVLSASFSGRCLVWKTGNELFSSCEGEQTRRQSSPGGRALIAFGGDGRPKAVYFPEQELWRGFGEEHTWYKLSLPGTVLSIALPDQATLRILEERDGVFWLSDFALAGGEKRKEEALTLAAPVIMDRRGRVASFAHTLGGSPALDWLGEEWIVVRTPGEAGRAFAPGHPERVYLLPEGGPQ